MSDTPERPTPETDAAICKCRDGYSWVKPSLAKRLERERDVARENTKAWHGEYRALNDLHRELGLKHEETLRERDAARALLTEFQRHGFIPSAEIGPTREIMRQRDEAIEKLTKACEDEHRMAVEVANITAERDEAREQARYGWERHAEKDAAYGKALAQRDRLLEALKKVEFFGATGCLQDSLDEAKRIARAAIAEVEGNR